MDLPRSLTSALDTIELNLLNRRGTLAADKDEQDSDLHKLLRAFGNSDKPKLLEATLSSYQFSQTGTNAVSNTQGFIIDSEWLVLAKACVVMVRTLMQELFSRTVPLGQDILYWEQLLSSKSWRGLYLLQSKSTLNQLSQ